MAKNRDEERDVRVDEWGDPIKSKAIPESEKLYTDEWGDPVKKVGVNEENREYLREREKLQLEKRLVNEDLIYPRGHYLPKGRFRGILALILAFLFGIFVVLGAIAGAGLYFGSTKLKRIFGDNISKYLTPDYADMSIIELITAVAGDLKDGISSLDDISKYTPLVDTLLDKADEYAEKYGVEYDRATLKSKPFKEIWGYVYNDVVKNIALGKTLYAAGFTDPTVLAIFLGEEGVDYTVEEGKIVLKEDGKKPVTVNDLMTNVMGTLNTVQLGLLLGLNKEPTEEKILGENAVMYALAYGRYGQDYTLENGKIKVLTDKANSETFTFPTAVGDLVNSPNAVVNSLELGSMLGLSGGFTREQYSGNAVMYALAYGTENKDYTVEWSGDVGTIKLSEDRREQYPTTIGALTTGSNQFINTIELGSLLGVKVTDETRESNALMIALCYGTEGTDFTANADGSVQMIGDKKATTIGDLTTDSNALINRLELGTMLGLSEQDKESNALMLALCYGTEGKDYTFVDGKVVMQEGHDEKYPTTVGSLTSGSNELINGLELGAMLGIADGFTQEEYESNTLMYSIAYGNEGTDYTVAWGEDGKGKIQMCEGGEAKTIGDLTSNSNELINGLELGTMLGVGSNITDEDKEQNALMLALCYGTEGKDYNIVEGKVQMLPGHDERYPTTVGALSEQSSELIQNMEVETLMGIKPTSDKLMHYIAYGPEMKKGEDGEYLKDEDGNYTTVQVTVQGEDGHEKTELQYEGGGRYVYTRDEDGNITGVEMLTDPNTGKPYPKRTVKDLTGEDADILGGMKIGDVTKIDENSSGLMRAMKDWTLDDLKDQSKIESLTIKELLDVDETDPKTSGLMKELAGYTVGQLKEPDTIDKLNVGNILGVDTSEGSKDSGLMKALAGHTVGQLKEPDTIDKLNVGDILDVDQDDENTSGLMKALADYTVGDLKKPDTIDGLNVGDILDVDQDDENTSGLMKELAQYNVSQLKDPDTIDGLNVGKILGVDKDSSKLMQALADKKVGDLKDPDTIESLTLGEIIEMDGSTSGILKAMEDWQISDLKNQNRIERLRIGQIIEVSSEATGFMAAIKNWRIGDLSEPSKVESLKLGDVITINEETGILAALKDTQIGRLQDGINELTLTELLGNIDDNIILRGLAESTVSSLSADIQNLTISTIFGDQIYSYMEIKDGKTYQSYYEDYFKNHATQHGADYLPKKYEAQNVETRLYIKNSGPETEVLKGYFEKGTDTPYPGKVLRDENGSYYNKKETLEVLTESKKVVYVEAIGDQKAHIDYQPLPEGITERDLQEDGFGGWYYLEEVAEEGKPDAPKQKVEVEKVVTGYKLNGTALTQDKDGWKLGETKVDVITEGDGAYILTRVDLEEKYYEKNAATKTYSIEETAVEKRFYDGEKQLDRYVSGVWFLLLGKIEGEESPTYDKNSGTTSEGKPGTVVFNGDPKLTEIADSITQVNTTLNDTTLWKLYFFGILPDDPFVDLKVGLTFEHTFVDAGGQKKTVDRKVSNLSDIAISELVPFIEAFTDVDFLANYLRESGFDFSRFLTP